MVIENLFANTIAHAYIFHRGDQSGVILFLEKKYDRKFGAHQNAILYDVENFGIEDSRTVTELGNLQNEGDTFISIVARSLTPEAQNALLKTLEEPRGGIHFLIFVDNPELLLPTLRSRCISVRKNVSDNKTGKSAHPDFLKIPLADRFAHIEKISKSLKKDDPTAFKDAALEIFDSIISQMSEKITSEKSSQKREALERILELRKYLNDRGSSPKQLLETMAMQLG